MAIEVEEVIFGPYGTTIYIEVDQGYTSSLALQIVTPTINSAPAALTVSVADAMGAGQVIFRVDGAEVFRVTPDPEGGIYLASIPIPNLLDGNGETLMGAGAHTLTATQGSAIGTQTFTIVNDPEPPAVPPAPDAPPVVVPGSVQPDATRRWVFQDLMPGGIGSWVLPMNPEDMGSPPFERELTAKTTTASEEIGGQFHIYEAAWEPAEWTFSGYCPTKAMREKFEQYHALNRRWYLHDHRGRVWVVTFQDLIMEPRLTQNWNGAINHEGHDYDATVLVMERDWLEVSP